MSRLFLSGTFFVFSSVYPILPLPPDCPAYRTIRRKSRHHSIPAQCLLSSFGPAARAPLITTDTFTSTNGLPFTDLQECLDDN
ncbi:hypothetical protein RvY_11758 [Ramazzottius varieornatus]|uniref:Secreted protein n=1 Tax=Ramazzottius varieornatus TaxID=947166 RepID=A0A1D1VR01_RAMVA|nr:hypothetical protein RvY_11758 [Ramazzottius varieornatus]